MALDACAFYYDGISSEDYGLYYYQIASFSPDAGKINNGFSVVSDRVSRRHQPIHYGVQKSDHMEFDIVFGALEYLDRKEIEAIAGWLLGRTKYAPLVFDSDDMLGVQYKAIFTGLDQIQYDGATIAFKGHVVCDSPFAYTETLEKIYKCSSGSTEFYFTSFSNVPELYAPDVEIELPANTDWKMENETTGEIVSFEFGGANTAPIILTICGKTKVLSYTCKTAPSLALNLYDCMKLSGEQHFVFPRVAVGNNKIKITCSGESVVHFTSEFPLQIGY